MQNVYVTVIGYCSGGEVVSNCCHCSSEQNGFNKCSDLTDELHVTDDGEDELSP